VQRSQNNKFDQQVKKTLEDASVEPPAFLWNSIESQLPPEKSWYSKSKYMLLLLLLVFTSTGSILVYKNFVLKGNSSQIALNKRLLKDEIGKDSEVNTKAGKANLKGEQLTSNPPVQAGALTAADNKTTKAGNAPSVSSFYKPAEHEEKSDAVLYAEQKEAAAAKRATRLKRLEVKSTDNELDNKTESALAQKNQTTAFLPAIANTESGNNSKKATRNKAFEEPKFTATKSLKINSEFDAEQKSNTVNEDNSISHESTVAATDNTQNEEISSGNNTTALSEDDITQPISEPIRKTDATVLTASLEPVKVQQTPIPSREALRSLIEPEKLQQLDISSQAAGITDLNPNKEKLLKNLKQFAGYDINKGFHIGAFISINNVWLNNKDFSADENTTSITPKVQFGKAYGINIGYDYTDRWGIELEWQISEQGQKYKMIQITEDHPCIKNVSLLYTKFPLMMKYKQTFINNYNSKPIALSFLFGPQVGLLLKKNVTMDGVEMQDTPEYNKAEFGLMGGFDFDLFITRNLAMTIGGRTGFASSLKKGQPMSFQLGVTTQFNFRFPKKIK
jgi:opacity protein-like surface antigen